MRIGLALHDGGGMESVQGVARGIRDALSAHHELVTLPATYTFGKATDRYRMARELVEASALLVGFPRSLLPLLEARQQVSRPVPAVMHVLGALPAGGFALASQMPLLTTRDQVVVTSTADSALARLFFPNIKSALIPPSYDDALFEQLSAGERTEIRASLGISDRSVMLLYAGRITLEKNLHTTLRVFAELCRHNSELHLVLAGRFEDAPFFESGIHPLSFRRTVASWVHALRLPTTRVHFLGPVEQVDLCRLYNAADVLVNLTLHHDENFGLAQVESTVCGTPVLNTAWGGLRDTIRDGVNGCTVATVATPYGVKVNWWEATNRLLVQLLGGQLQLLGNRRSVAAAAAPYQSAVCASQWRSLVASMLNSEAHAEPVRVSEFTECLWAMCASSFPPHAQYVHGTYSFSLYQELIAHYTRDTSSSIANGAPYQASEALVLSAAMHAVSDTQYVIGDPLYPFDVAIPWQWRTCIARLVRAFNEQPVRSFADVRHSLIAGDGSELAALDWLIRQGLLLRTQVDAGWLSPSQCGRDLLSTPFGIQRVPSAALDALCYRV